MFKLQKEVDHVVAPDTYKPFAWNTAEKLSENVSRYWAYVAKNQHFNGEFQALTREELQYIKNGAALFFMFAYGHRVSYVHSEFRHENGYENYLTLLQQIKVSQPFFNSREDELETLLNKQYIADASTVEALKNTIVVKVPQVIDSKGFLGTFRETDFTRGTPVTYFLVPKVVNARKSKSLFSLNFTSLRKRTQLTYDDGKPLYDILGDEHDGFMSFALPAITSLGKIWSSFWEFSILGLLQGQPKHVIFEVLHEFFEAVLLYGRKESVVYFADNNFTGENIGKNFRDYVFLVNARVQLKSDMHWAQMHQKRIATAFETKRNIPAIYQKHMANNAFKHDFNVVEIDSDTDLSKFSIAEDAWSTLRSMSIIFKPKLLGTYMPSIRFRKLGKYDGPDSKTLGMYNPQWNSLAISIAEGGTTSLVHEWGHYLDYSLLEDNKINPYSWDNTDVPFGQLSSTYEANAWLSAARDFYDQNGESSKMTMYRTKSTEIFARGFEVYIATKFGEFLPDDFPLFKSLSALKEKHEYASLLYSDVYTDIISYFDGLIERIQDIGSLSNLG